MGLSNPTYPIVSRRLMIDVFGARNVTDSTEIALLTNDFGFVFPDAKLSKIRGVRFIVPPKYVSGFTISGSLTLKINTTNTARSGIAANSVTVGGSVDVNLFGFTLSYDEIARTALAAGAKNTLPLEIWAMTTNVTSPTLYAVGAVTTIVSFLVIVMALNLVARLIARFFGNPTGR